MHNVENWLIAIRAPGLAGKKLVDAVGASGDIEQLIGGGTAHWRKLGLNEETIGFLKNPDTRQLAADLEWLEADQHQLICWDQESYPALLREIPAPPAALFVSGNPDFLWRPQVAVIGSRNPTVAGLEHARAFSRELTRCGITVTSGMASGIDAAAHEGALDANGVTIAVCGTGPDQVYPASSRELAGRIERSGALVTEFPTGFPPRKAHFPARNRIISGLSLGVLVIEAGLNSGTLITARQAGEQGREVFALPGSLHNPMVKGCHRLIREGARLVETVQDVLTELGPVAQELAGALQSRINADTETGEGVQAASAEPLDDPEYQILLDALGHEHRTVDELVQLTGLPVRNVSSMLLLLDLQGRIAQHASGTYARRGKA